MATNEMSTKVITGKVRFSYCAVFEPKAMEGQEKKKYSVALLISKKDKKTIAAVTAAIEAAKQAGKAGKFGGKFPANLKMPMRDGDVERPESAEYKGHFFISASSDMKPGVVDADLNPIIDREDFYSGCYGRASVNFYAFNTAGNKGVACGLNNLQKMEDGERLAGGASAEEDFAEFSNDAPDVPGGDDDDFL